MKILETVKEYNETLISADKNDLIILDFYADWCGPCRMISPKLEKLVSGPPNVVKIYKVNVDNDDIKEVVEKHKIVCMPTFVFIKDKKVVSRVEGANLSALESKISELSN